MVIKKAKSRSEAMKALKKVAIVIVNYNGKQDTLDCLRSIRKMKTEGDQLKIYVVDNASSDDSVNAIKRELPSVNLILNQANYGFAGGNNIGIKQALEDGVDYVLLVNNDTLVSQPLLNELLKAITKDEDIGVVVPKIYFAPGYEFHKKRYSYGEKGKVIWYAGGRIDWENMYGKHIGVDEVDKGQFSEEQETDFASGCCLLVKRQVFEKVGLFDERFFLYQEDLDWSIRAQKAGYRIVYCPLAYLWHKNAGSSNSGSSLQDYYMTRNRMLVGWSYAPWRTKAALIKESINKLFRGRKWEKIGVRDFYLGRFGKGSYET